MTKNIERYRTTMFGCHVGDCLGGPLETFTREDIEKFYGKITGFMAPRYMRDKQWNIIPIDKSVGTEWYSWHAQQRVGEPSDDTILTVAMAEALGKHGYDLQAVAVAHITAIEELRRPDGTVDGGFGRTTLDAVARLAAGIHPLESGIPGIGNAPPMKMSPVGMYMDLTNRYDAGLVHAKLVGKMTHTDPRSVAAGVTQAHSVYALLQNVDRKEFLESAYDVARHAEEPLDSKAQLASKGSLTARLGWVKNHTNASVADAHKMLSSGGFVIESYPYTIFMMQKYWDDPLTGLFATVESGGDTDSTGAMYGTLAAARHGHFWPSEWDEKLEYRERILSATRLLNGGTER
jgi:ADP-ribosyl-[dinitrogen reductase] hydrolase